MDDIRLLVHPLVAGRGRALFSGLQRRRFDLQKPEALPDGRLSLIYAARPHVSAAVLSA